MAEGCDAELRGHRLAHHVHQRDDVRERGDLNSLRGAGRAVNGSPERKNKKAVSLRGFDAEPVVAALLEHD